VPGRGVVPANDIEGLVAQGYRAIVDGPGFGRDPPADRMCFEPDLQVFPP
jgi:hypothetical protein